VAAAGGERASDASAGTAAGWAVRGIWPTAPGSAAVDELGALMTFEEDGARADAGADAGARMDVPFMTIGASQCRQRIRILRPATFSSGTTYFASQLVQVTFMGPCPGVRSLRPQHQQGEVTRLS